MFVPSVTGQPETVAGYGFVSVSAPANVELYWMLFGTESVYCVVIA